MIEPLALVLYEKILPGTRLVSLLQDLHYRVKTLHDPDSLPETAVKEMPMLVLADLEPWSDRLLRGIAALKSNASTEHIPVVVFAADARIESAPAPVVGATLTVSETAVLNHLPQLLEQALQL